MLVRVTDLKQWGFCRRIVYYQSVMPGVGKPTFKMEEGRKAQEVLERLETRRTLRRYGLESARREFGVWLSDEKLGLTGKADLLLVGEKIGSVVEFKLTSGEPGENHRLQLAGYAMLAEATRGVRVDRALLYRIPDERVFALAIGQGLRERVREAIAEIRRIREQAWFPAPTPVRGRCVECEYANYCADIW